MICQGKKIAISMQYEMSWESKFFSGFNDEKFYFVLAK